MMDNIELRVHIQRDVDMASATVCLLKPGRELIPSKWKAFVETFLVHLANQVAVIFVLETPNQYDWYSEFCDNRGIPVSREVMPKRFARLKIGPAPPTYRQELIAALAEDEVWQIGGLLTIWIGNDPMGPLRVGNGAQIRPIADGEAFEWVGPAKEISTLMDGVKHACAVTDIAFSISPKAL